MRTVLILLGLLLMPAVLAQGMPSSVAFDADGRRVALRSQGSAWDGATVTVFEDAGEGWRPALALPLPPWTPIDFVAGMLSANGQLHVLEGDKARAVGEPLRRLRIMALGEHGVYQGERAFVPDTFFPEGEGRFHRATAQGWQDEEVVPAQAGVPSSTLVRRVALNGARMAVLLIPIQDKCGVLVFDRGEAGWQRSALFFPDVCAAGQQAMGGDIALDGDTLLIGAHPGPGDGPGKLALFALRDGHWEETSTLERPVQQDDHVTDELLPYAFGHRVALRDGLIFAGGGYQQILEHVPGVSTRALTVLNGVFVIGREGEGWQTRAHYVHFDPRASFGGAFEVRGARLLVDSPDEDAAYLFERRGDVWSQLTRLPPE